MARPAQRCSLSVSEYQAELAALVDAVLSTQRVLLDDAAGRVLAGRVVAAIANPTFDNSAMDGYAVRYDEVSAVPVRLRVCGGVASGGGKDPAFGPGTCVRIMTGAPLPSAADTVVPVEDTDGGEDVVEIQRVPRARAAHVRRAGEDYPAGTVVAEEGSVLTPGVIGAVAAAGATTAEVYRRPVVAVCATGDELVADGAPLARGQIYDSNSHALAAALRRAGAEVVRGGPVPDRAGMLASWLDGAAETSDLIVVTGGASVGAYDVVRDLLSSRADGVFRHVRVQPGKPQGWARWNGTPVIALPGNPMSASLCCEVFVRPVISRLLHRTDPADRVAVAASGWTCPPGRMQLLPVTLTTTARGVLTAMPVHRRGSASHLVSALAGADAIAMVGEDVAEVRTGDPLAVRGLW